VARALGVTSGPSALFAGLCVVDLVHRVTRPPGPDEKVTALSQEINAGGPATNAAITFAVLGGTATLVTAVGTRELGAVVRADLARPGLTLVDLAGYDRSFQPSVSAVLVTDATGERSVVSRDAAALEERSSVALTRAALPETVDVVLLDGHYPTVAVEVAGWARTRRIPVVLDAGRWKPHLAPLFGLVDEVVCSGDLTGPTGPGFAALAAYAHGLGARVVAQTHGPEAIDVSVEGRRSRVPVPSVTAVDTLGAGDVLHGAYAFHRALGTDAEAALAAAAEVASFRCGLAGSRGWVEAWPNT
jgi:sugar/nucleoside kinase (ribokinase family)